MVNLEELFQEITTERVTHLERERQFPPPVAPRASDLSPCVRETVLGLLHYDMRPQPPIDRLARYEVGDYTESRVVMTLQKMGFRVVDQQTTFEIRNKQGRVIIRGHIDGRLLYHGERVPFDVKSMHPNIFSRMHTAEDFARHAIYLRYIRQIMSYMYLTDSEQGFLFLDNCLGDWKFIPVSLDYAAMENILKQCETAVDVTEKIHSGIPEEEALPPYHPSVEVCQRCWARGRCCIPPRLADEAGILVWDDPELEAMIESRQSLHLSHVEFDRVDKKLKDVLKGRESVIVGNWLVTGKPGKTHHKAKEAYSIDTWSITYQPLTEPSPETQTDIGVDG